MNRKNALAADLYCITAEDYSLGRSNIEIVKQWIAADIKVIQYREKEKDMKKKYEECKIIRELTKEADVTFIVNDDIDLAMMVQADGVHIGQDDFPLEAVRQLVGDQMIIGISTHSPEQAQRAVKAGADYIGVGPIFKTSTKKNVCDPVGLEYLKYVVDNISIPFVAIGGIKESNVLEVVHCGAKCIAMVTEITQAQNIGKKINDIRKIIKGMEEK
ncbi:thiamine phosphate synthase [Pelosinus propionicus]|uniref:Thiamine-phosphate synthase n=1 Tax=Pelosinus propionicus DSM 13327 TaxID=1123291 RepID=A0A1I4PX31_9FIRM|nr:thiamine phosphate synthase [Pelosinus propionicus]SFM32367.1 thiamine-phosphate diphosphorylase [Pelosinus propionicus DSM 13327]